MVSFESKENEKWVLSGEGEMIAAEGSHEAKVFNLIPAGENGLAVAEIQKQLGSTGQIGLSRAFKNKWIAQKNSETVVRKVINKIFYVLKKILKIQFSFSDWKYYWSNKVGFGWN